MKNSQKILVIDDSNTNIVLLEAILETRGYKIMTALSVKEAIPMIEKELPDLILLDLLMPEVNGFDFLEKIKNEEKFQGIPVIIVSALTDDENINRTMEMGAVEFIKKPVNIERLVSRVENVLESV